jgi:hypothetical protein
LDGIQINGVKEIYLASNFQLCSNIQDHSSKFFNLLLRQQSIKTEERYPIVRPDSGRFFHFGVDLYHNASLDGENIPYRRQDGVDSSG